MNKKDYYKLYSIPLHRFLRVNGMKPISKGVNPHTGKTFWVYVVDDRLSELLTAWTDNKPNKN